MNKFKDVKKYVLLDRDGTIIVDKVYLSDPNLIEFETGAIAGLKLLMKAGIGLIIVTNQSGIARGLITSDQLAKIHERLSKLLKDHSINIEAIYFCPHGPNDECVCRKPKPGMVLQALEKFRIELDSAVLIGDSESDMGAALTAGIKAIKIDSLKSEPNSNYLVCNDFLSAAQAAIAILG